MKSELKQYLAIKGWGILGFTRYSNGSLTGIFISWRPTVN